MEETEDDLQVDSEDEFEEIEKKRRVRFNDEEIDLQIAPVEKPKLKRIRSKYLSITTYFKNSFALD